MCPGNGIPQHWNNSCLCAVVKRARNSRVESLSLLQELWVDKGDDVLQELVAWANQKVGSKGLDEGVKEGWLVRDFLTGQQHLYFLWAAFAFSSSWDVVGGWRRGLSVRSLASHTLFTVGGRIWVFRMGMKEKEQEIQYNYILFI